MRLLAHGTMFGTTYSQVPMRRSEIGINKENINLAVCKNAQF